MDPRYSVAGLLIGGLIGLTGVGGGSLMTPVLILLLHFKPTVAVGSDMVYSSVTKVVGGWQHHRQGTVNYDLVWRLAIGSVPGSLAGVWWVHRMQAHSSALAEHVIMRMLGIVLIVVAVTLLWKSSRGASAVRGRFATEDPRRRTVVAGTAGLLLGFLVGVTSVGSGSLYGVLMLVVFGLAAKEMVGTDVLHAAILTSAAAGAQIWAGNVDYRLVGSLLIGSIPGVLVGSRLSARTPDAVLRPVLASVLILSGLKMM